MISRVNELLVAVCDCREDASYMRYVGSRVCETGGV